MKRERAKELLPIIQAYAEGKKIQFSYNGVTYIDAPSELNFEDSCVCKFRLKPEIDYTWKNPMNCNGCEYAAQIPCNTNRLYYPCSQCTKDDSQYRKAEIKYRPFKSCNELVYYWERKKVGYSVNPLQMVDIWVKHKVDGRRRMIVGFSDNFVEVGVKAKPITLERLFEMYTFLDGSPCGVSNGKEESNIEN